MRTVYRDIEADTVCFTLYFARFCIVVVIGEEVESVEFFLQVIIGNVAGAFPIDERTVSGIGCPFAVQLALFGGKSQRGALFGGDFVQAAVDKAITAVGILRPPMGIGHAVGVVAPESVYKECSVGYALAEIRFVRGVQHSRTARQYIIYRVAEGYHDGQLCPVALVVLMIRVVKRFVTGVQITATGNKQQHTP